jgi:hypothetical protein
MRIPQSTVMLLVVLVALVGVSVYLWAMVGTGRPEVDHRVASTLESFSCAKCGHSFTMTTGQVSHMRRSRGEIFCPKCGEGGARKETAERPTGHASSRSSKNAQRPREQDPPEVPSKTAAEQTAQVGGASGLDPPPATQPATPSPSPD